MIALRSINFTGGGADPEEEMYKEFLIGIAENTLSGTVTIPDGITDVKRDFFMTSLPLMTELIANFTTMTKRPYYNCSGLKVLRLPNLTTIGNSMFNSANALTDIYIPSATIFDAAAFYPRVAGVMRTVHIETKTCDEIKAIRNFPGAPVGMGYDLLRFVGSDGTLTWDGSAWVKS